MKKILSTDGHEILVDDDDFVWASKLKWYTVKGRYTRYAMRSIRKGNKIIHKAIHTIMTGVNLTDHKDGNGLNNQKYNLRSCNDSQNMQNRLSYKSISGYKGVTWSERDYCYYATIGINKKIKRLGCFRSATKAARAYDKAAIEYFGEFAKTNKMLGLL